MIKKQLKASAMKLSRVMLKPVYKIYEKWLWIQIKNGRVPRHVAVIPDGNRRWAKLRDLPPWLGHEFGYKRLKEVLDWIWDLGIEVVTIYAMSSENCTRRSLEERKRLFDLMRKALNEVVENIDDFRERGVRIRVLGRKELIPRDLIELSRMIEKLTSTYPRKHILNIALCYGGRQEIVDAVKRIALDVSLKRISVDDINENLFSKYLYTNDVPDPDLIIRTSGEERISNFLLWQSAYSELYFCEVYWPDFRRIDLWRAIRSYQKRERRFGK